MGKLSNLINKIFDEPNRELEKKETLTNSIIKKNDNNLQTEIKGTKYWKLNSNNLFNLFDFSSIGTFKSNLCKYIYIKDDKDYSVVDLIIISSFENNINFAPGYIQELECVSLNFKMDNNKVVINFFKDKFTFRLEKTKYTDVKENNQLFNKVAKRLNQGLVDHEFKLDDGSYHFIINNSDFYNFMNIMSKYNSIYYRNNITEFYMYEILKEDYLSGGNYNIKIQINDIIKQFEMDKDFIIEKITENDYKKYLVKENFK